MFKNMRKIGVIVSVLVLLVIVFFIFYVPSGSVEGRANLIQQIFKRKDVADIHFELVDYLSDLKNDERAEVFNALPFSLVKENPDLLIAVFDESYPDWRELASFNSNYLMTEVELIEKQNASPIKHTEPVKVKNTYSELSALKDDIASTCSKEWNIEDKALYVVDGTIKCDMEIKNKTTEILSFEISVFDIKTGYVFGVKYNKGNLVIEPMNTKIEDNGAFELSEKLGIYDRKRLKDFVSKHYKLSFSEYRLILSDSFSEGTVKTQVDMADNKQLSIVLYSDMIKMPKSEKEKNISYAGTMIFQPLNIKNNAEKPSFLREKISLNIFKADR